MRKNRTLCLSWLLVFLIIVKISMDDRQENTSFQGIAESRELIINSESAVEIRNIHVTPGERIQKGRLLVELKRPELDMKISGISHELEGLKLQGNFDLEDVRSRIGQLKAKKSVIRSEAELKISQLRSRLDFNKKLAAGLKTIGRETYALKRRNPVETEIDGLKKERNLKLSRIQIEIDALEKQLASKENPVDVRIKSLEKERKLLLEEKKKLLTHARADAIVGSVLCKIGEKISPFTPMLTLYQQSPTYVKAYIHEKIHHQVKTGDKVEVVSLSGGGKSVDADIVGTGSRIVEFPNRLRKRPDFKIWGREVEVRLPEENAFLLGEKVMVNPPSDKEKFHLSAYVRQQLDQWLNLSLYAAETSDIKEKNDGTLQIHRSKSLGKIPEIEASGLLFLPELDRFLLISDETEKELPIFYLMESDGMVRDKVTVRGIETIDDMESVCADEKGVIYVASSQSRKKNGALPDRRKLLVQIRRAGTDFEAVQQILLYDLLENAAKTKSDAAWARLMREQELEIEGMFHRDQALYLGCKAPLNGGRAIILRIGDIEKAFRENRFDADAVSIWRELDLRDDQTGHPARISDLYFYQNRLYLLSCMKNGDVRRGALRIYDSEGNVVKLKYFDGLNPEGVAVDTIRNEVVVTFDLHGEQPSKMIRLEDV